MRKPRAINFTELTDDQLAFAEAYLGILAQTITPPSSYTVLSDLAAVGEEINTRRQSRRTEEMAAVRVS